MKNQGLITTLAVLLAVSLSAIVALVVTSEVIGAQPVADTPAAIEIEVSNPAPSVGQTTTGSDSAGNDVGNIPATNDGAVAGDEGTTTDDVADDQNDADNVDTGDENNGDTDANDGADDGEEDTGDEDGEDTGDEASEDGEDGDADEGDEASEDGEDGDADEGDEGDDDPAPGDDPVCNGTIVDGICIPTLILCQLGYELVNGECVFAGCPLGYLFLDGICDIPVLTLPCDDGFTLVNGNCVLVIDPGNIVPICPDGEHLQNGECVPDFVITPGILIPGLELAADG